MKKKTVRLTLPYVTALNISLILKHFIDDFNNTLTMTPLTVIEVSLLTNFVNYLERRIFLNETDKTNN